MTDEKIIDRIKKMLNLAKSANQHEAATAMAMAQRLLEKHALTLSDLNLENIIKGYAQSQFSVSKITQYESMLASTVDRAFGVGHYWRTSHSLTQSQPIRILGLRRPRRPAATCSLDLWDLVRPPQEGQS